MGSSRARRAFGVFDGVHRGIATCAGLYRSTAAENRRLKALTFDIDPDEVFIQRGHKKLFTQNEERVRMLVITALTPSRCCRSPAILAASSPEEFSQT